MSVEDVLAKAQAASAADGADLRRVIDASPTFEAAVRNARIVFPDWRLGQTVCNVLREVRPDLRDQLQNSPVDCFYLDSKVGDYMLALSGELI